MIEIPPGDDPVGAEHADAEIGDVHRAALALAVAGLPPVELGHHAVEVGALGDAVAVAAMRRDDPVAAIERGADADGDRLLADVAVHDAVDLAGEIIGRGALLEAADGEHLAQHLALLVGRQVRGHGPSGQVRAFRMGQRSKAGNREIIACALYLGQTVYRIHGTNAPETIGHAVSSGCFRLVNDDVADLYGRVPVGAKVIVSH